MKDLAYWIALHHAPGVGATSFAELLQRFGAPRILFEQTDAVAREARLAPQTLEWLRRTDWAAVERDLQWAEQPGNHILTLADSAYPALLKEIADPPPLLYVNGEAAVLSMPQLAMVGSRSPTPTGRETALEFARHLVAEGLTITSGLALGVDGACHRGALAAKGPTIAVTGTGPDRVYPARHRELAHQIVDAGGALVSEYPVGTPPLAENFPRRNRIISGLSLGVLVVEAAIRSGSLITARLAGEHGREVFAIPGSIHNPLARGCHQLIRQGAKLVESAEDVLEELGPLARLSVSSAAGSLDSPAVADARELDPGCQQVLECVGYEPTPMDVLIERSGLTTDVVSSMLMVLELHGYITSAPGGVYSRV